MKFEKYSTYSVDSFLEDEDFRAWINHPTAEREQFWETFVKQYPQQKATVDQARYILREMNEYFAKSDQVSTAEDDRFREVLRQTMEEAKSQKQIRLYKRKVTRRIAVAASIGLVLAAFSWLWLRPVDHLQTIATGFGEWKTVELPDGSTVKLNANSEIRLAETWSEGADRQVWLQGEAFFQVEKKPQTNAKFKVITTDLTVEVYGTSFNVRSRDEQTSVFLEEGEIKLDLGQQQEYLHPGDFIVYSAREKTITERKQKAVAEKHTSWKDGALILKDTPTIVILRKIKELYGLDITVKNEEILSREKTIMVPMDKIEIAIPILERTLNVQIEKTDKKLIIN